MGSDENLSRVVEGFREKNSPDLIGVLTSGLSEVKGDDVGDIVRNFTQHDSAKVLYVPTPDYEGGLETGYSKAVETLTTLCKGNQGTSRAEGQVNVLAGSHLTPADFTEVREIFESFGLRPIMLPDLSALDGSRRGISALAVGGTTIGDIESMGSSEFTIGIGLSMERPAKLLEERFGIEYRIFESIAGMKDVDMFMETLSFLSGKEVSGKYERQRRILIDGMRDAHFYYGNKRVCIALEPDLSLQTSRWLDEMGADVDTVVIPQPSPSAERVRAGRVIVGDLFSVEEEFDLLISNSHAEDTAKRLCIPFYQTGFPVYKILGNNSTATIGYGGSLRVINDVANILMGSY